MTTPGPPTLRLFLALWPAAEVRGALEAHARSWAWPPAARRTPGAEWHITLHFLGQVAQERLAALRAALDLRWAGCELSLDRAQVWPGGIAVLEAGTVPAELAALHAALAERLRALQLPVEPRRWRPHVTFARKAAGARPPAAFAPLRWPAAPGYALVQSVGNGGGYRTVQRFG